MTVSSQAHRLARRLSPEHDLTGDGRYRKWLAYGRSKLANLLFMFELDRRARAQGLPLTSVAAHPGYAATNLMSSGINLGGTRLDGRILAAATGLLAQPAESGAWPLLMAATLPDLPSGSYIGPSGPGEVRGVPALVSASRTARDPELAAALWHASEQATGVRYVSGT